MGGAASRAGGRSYKAAREASAKAVSAAADGEAASLASTRPAAMPRQDVLRPDSAAAAPSATSQTATQRPDSPLGPSNLAEMQSDRHVGSDDRDYVQASMLDQLAGAITRHDRPQPGSVQAPTQRQRPRPKDDRPPFSIVDLQDVMQAAQQAVLQGRRPDVSALAARYKLDEATLARALQHTSLPLVRKDEQGNMFATAATPEARQRLEADSQGMAEGGPLAEAQAPAGPTDTASATAPGLGRQGGPQQRPSSVEQPAPDQGVESGRRSVQQRPASWG